MGKSSIVSRFNLPGKFAWFTMEVPSLLVISYIMYTLPEELGLSSLPNENWLMASLYVRNVLSYTDCFLLILV